MEYWFCTLDKVVTFILLVDALYWLSPLLGLTKWAAYGEAQIARNLEWPLADSQQGTEAFSLTTYKEPNPDNSRTSLEANLLQSSFRWDSSPRWHFDHSFVKDSKVEDSANPWLDS